MPFAMGWPGQIPAGQVLNGIVSLEDVVPTVMAAAGVPDVKEQLLQGYQAGEKNFRVHLDGYDQLPYFSGRARSRRATSSSTTGSTFSTRSATGTGKSISRSRTTCSRAS